MIVFGYRIDRSGVVDKIDAAIRFFLYVLIFWLPYSPAVIESCVITALILWVIKRSISHDWKVSSSLTFKDKVKSGVRAFQPNPSFLNKPILFFITACLLSVASSAFFDVALRGLITKTLEWFVIYFLVIEAFSERKHIFIALGIFLFSSFATCLDGIVQFHITHKDIFYGRTIAVARGGATAAFNHPNGFGSYLIFVIPIVLSYLFFYKEKKALRYFFICFFVIALWSVVITFSRGAWVAINAGLLFFLFIYKKKILFCLALIIMVLFICIYIFSSSNMKQNFRMDSGSLYGALEWRKGLWVDSVKMIKDKPFFGHGLNTYMTLFQEYRRKYNELHNYSPTYAHNCYIQIASELGLFGLALFMYLLLTFFRKTIEMIRRFSTLEVTDFNILLIGLTTGTFAYLTQSFLDTNLYSLQLSALFWLMVGITISIFNLLNRSVVCDKKIVY